MTLTTHANLDNCTVKVKVGLRAAISKDVMIGENVEINLLALVEDHEVVSANMLVQ